MTVENNEWAPLGVNDVQGLFADWPAPWGIAGGWALDLFLGRQTRRHDDIDVLLRLQDQALLHERLASDWELHLAENGALTRLRPVDRLTAEADIWARRDARSPWAFQLMLIDAADGVWTYRRARSVRRPADELFLEDARGVPYLRPEIQLLYKGGSASIRNKDQRDFEVLLPRLGEEERAWLEKALRAQFPQGHRWLDRLAGKEDGEMREASAQESPEQESLEQESPEQESPEQESPEQEGPEQVSLEQVRHKPERSEQTAEQTGELQRERGAGTTRPYLRLIQRAAGEDVSFETITPDLTYRARKGGASFLMTDAELGLNPSSASALALSKSAASDALGAAGVPAVAHVFLPHPGYRFGGGAEDAYARAEAAYVRCGGDAVVKPDDGAQGRHVYRVRSPYELREALAAVYALERHAALSPYCEAELEYRVVVLAGEARVWVGKRRVGSWKHNLAEGARSIEVPGELRDRLSPLAVRAAAALDMTFCSVDILDTVRHGPLVIEINHKVMLGDHYKQHPESEAELAALYGDAIRMRFDGL